MNGREADFTRSLVELLHVSGWLVCHHPDSRLLVGDAGLPDILAVRDGRLLAIETKSAKGRLRDGQQRWLSELSMVDGVTALVLRQGKTPDEVIEKLLREGE